MDEIQAYRYPYAEDVNHILHRIICDNSVTEDKGALMTQWNCFDVEEFNVIADYAKSLIDRPTKLVDLWGQVYQYGHYQSCLLYTSPSPRDLYRSRMPSSA